MTGRIDVGLTRSLVTAAHVLPVTFHRAFDLASDLDAALDALAEVGVRRVLTSGGAATAIEGADRLAALVARAGEHLAILAGGGIREDNVRELVRRSGVREIHVRGTRLRRKAVSFGSSTLRLRKPLPEDEGAWEETDESRIATMRRLAEEPL